VRARGDFDHPRNVKEALARSDAPLWIEAINKEFGSFFTKRVYKEVKSLPPGANALRTQLILDIKRDQYGNIVKYKARLVACGNQQIEGVDFFDLFAPTAQIDSFRAIISIAAQQRLYIHQIDVSTAFLNGDLEEEVYVELPSTVAPPGTYWKLEKSMYGLRQAARAWHSKMRAALLSKGFRQSHTDPCVFYRGSGRDLVYLLIHVDDGLIVGVKQQVLIARDVIAKLFEITEAGEAQCFLSIEIKRSSRGIVLSQEQYCRRLLEQYGFQGEHCKGRETPMALGTSLVKEGTPLPEDNQFRAKVGGFLYLACNTRPDISHATTVLTQFLSSPTVEHETASKHILRYLYKYPDVGLFYAYQPEGECEPYSGGRYSWWCQPRGNPLPLGALPADAMPAVDSPMVYTDADYGNDKDSRKSISGMMTHWYGPIAWHSRKQTIVTTSTCEAELVAAAAGCKQGLWLRKLLSEPLMRAIEVEQFCDNDATIALIKNETAGVSGRSKHIDVQFKFVRERCMRKEVVINYIPTNRNLADLFTKPLSADLFHGACAELGLLSQRAFEDSASS
jgi:hypothetical protein